MEKLLTAENMYWHVRHHLLTQGKKSRDSQASVWIADNGCRCSAGCMIPEAWQKEATHDGSVGFEVPADAQVTILSQYMGIRIADTGMLRLNASLLKHHEIPTTFDNVQLLCDLEIVHEDHEVDAWEAELDKIAIKYKLCDVMISPKSTARLPKKNATLDELVK